RADDGTRTDAHARAADVGRGAGVAVVAAGSVGERAVLAAAARVAGILRARVAVVAIGGGARDTGPGDARVVQAAARSVLAGRAVGRGRRAAGTAGRVAAAGLVAGVERDADDRVTAHAGARLARIDPGALVAAGARAP